MDCMAEILQVARDLAAIEELHDALGGVLACGGEDALRKHLGRIHEALRDAEGDCRQALDACARTARGM